MRYGSLNNLMVDQAKCPKPEVGMGCTMLSWTDRSAGTVVAVGPDSRAQPGFPTWVEVQEDHATRTDSNGMSECQAYTFEPNKDGAKWKYTLRRHGQYRRFHGCARVLFGRRDQYHDYSF